MPKDNLLEEAVKFAAEKHAGQYRKGTKLPYITHPMEAAAICASFTEDVEVLAAVVLHDTVEDAGATVDEIEGKFGSRVASIVTGESSGLSWWRFARRSTLTEASDVFPQTRLKGARVSLAPKSRVA